MKNHIKVLCLVLAVMLSVLALASCNKNHFKDYQNNTNTDDMEFYMESFDPNYPYTLLEMFLHSFLYAGGSALFQVACTVVAAYCTAKYKGPVSSFTYNLVIVTIALPIVGKTFRHARIILPWQINRMRLMGHPPQSIIVMV